MWYVYTILMFHIFFDTPIPVLLLDIAAICVLIARKYKP